MKLINVSEIEANDDHRWDNITLAPVTVVLALALAAQVLFGFGCGGDGSDEDGQTEEVEARDIPRDGVILPYKPGLPAVSELALDQRAPDAVYTDGLIAPVSAPEWNIASGGLQKWYRRTFRDNDAGYRPNVNAVLGQTAFYTNCYRDTTQWNPTLVCGGYSHKCPLAVSKTPIAYEKLGSGIVYGWTRYYVTEPAYLVASTVALRTPAGKLPYVECMYNTTIALMYVGVR